MGKTDTGHVVDEARQRTDRAGEMPVIPDEGDWPKWLGEEPRRYVAAKFANARPYADPEAPRAS